MAIPALGTNRRADINHDGMVDVGDVSTALEEILSGTGNPVIDINGDGAVDVGDVNEILALILNPEPYHDPADYISGTLPVMYVNTEGYKTVNSKEHYWDGVYWLDPMGQPGVKPIGDEAHPLPLQIKGRGNYTWTLYKKPYRVKLDTKAAILGMSNSKHWCLLPHADDYLGYLRDETAFELSRIFELGYTPSQMPVELVLNGEYLGLYFVGEKIRVEKNRVNIQEQNNLETDLSLITGGWLLEIDNYGDTNTIKLTENGEPLWLTPDSPEVLSSEQLSYISTLIETIIASLYTDEPDNPQWTKYLDVTSAAKYYIIQEILDNIEGYHGSCYLYKDRGEHEKLMFGPVWDFGSAYFRALDAAAPQKFVYDNDTKQRHFITGLVRFPVFQAEVKRLWRTFYKQEPYYRVLGHCDEFIKSIAPAADSDNRRWPEGESQWFEVHPTPFKNLLENRCRWLDSQWAQDTGSSSGDE